MWVKHVSNADVVKLIYNDRDPSLEDVCYFGIKLAPGEDLKMYLDIDIQDWPDDIPYNWQADESEHSFVTIHLELNKVSVNSSDLNYLLKDHGNFFHEFHCSIALDKDENGIGQLIIKDENKNPVLDLNFDTVALSEIFSYDIYED
ncbi:MAG TPA: hypothetical protein PLN63_06565 [Paludibacteraceae bacterium]|jgi:hypothetical protein|nr:hypothetical protein [Paludibacteraceae bacterium]HPH63264.1 hypothetical protein [Paludibacteraceae bacterium]